MRQEDDAWSVEFTIVTGILVTALSIMVLNIYYRFEKCWNCTTRTNRKWIIRK